MREFFRKYLGNQRGEFMMAALPYISAGFSVLQGLAGFAAGRQNAAYAEADAKQAKMTAAAEATRQRRIVIAQQAEFTAGVGAQGTTFEGSPMVAYMENVKAGEMQAQDKLYEGKLKARSFKAQADIYKREGTMALLGGLAQAGGTLGSHLLKTK